MIPPVPLSVPEFAWIWDINAAAPTGGRSKTFGKTRVLPRAQQFSVPTLRQNGDRGIWKGQAQGPQLWNVVEGLYMFLPFYAIHVWSIWEWFSIGFSNDFHSHKPSQVKSRVSGCQAAQRRVGPGSPGSPGPSRDPQVTTDGCVKFGRTWDLDDLGIPPWLRWLRKHPW